jgi:ATP citrate (pro-S)-lyase
MLLPLSSFGFQVKIWVRRAGPNYQEGLQMMRQASNDTGLDIHIYGPETHITAVVPLALGLQSLEKFPEFDDEAHLKQPSSGKRSTGMPPKRKSFHRQVADHEADHKVENFTALTRCVVYGLQNRAVQGMLDFDFICKRERPSVAAMVFPFSANHYIKVSA